MNKFVEKCFYLKLLITLLCCYELKKLAEILYISSTFPEFFPQYLY